MRSVKRSSLPCRTQSAGCAPHIRFGPPSREATRKLDRGLIPTKKYEVLIGNECRGSGIQQAQFRLVTIASNLLRFQLSHRKKSNFRAAAFTGSLRSSLSTIAESGIQHDVHQSCGWAGAMKARSPPEERVDRFRDSGGPRRSNPDRHFQFRVLESRSRCKSVSHCHSQAADK